MTATDPHFDLTGRVAVVTGASGLLGIRHCRALAAHGAAVVATDLEAADPERAIRELAALEPEAARPLALAMDVTRRESVEAALERVLSAHGRIDVLVNNAAVDDKVEGRAGAVQGRFEEYPPENWRRALDVNLTGVFLSCQVMGGEMARRRRGAIINIASTYGLVAPDQGLYVRPDGARLMYKNAAYPVTKAAVLSLTRYLAAYWGEAGVRVNALSPGGVDHGQDEWFRAAYARRTPLGRMARRDEYEGALVFLAADASSYMTGANLVVDGGWTAW